MAPINIQSELHRVERPPIEGLRTPIRTQRTHLQSALLSHIPPGCLQLGRRVAAIKDGGTNGVELFFADGSKVEGIDLVVGADGIRSVVRDSAWTDYQLKFTGTTIWRTLLPWDDVRGLGLNTTAWW